MKQSKTLRRWELALLLGVACAALLGVWLDGAQAALSDQVIRLHVLANSDSEADQALKLRVRDRILARRRSCLFPEPAGRRQRSSSAPTCTTWPPPGRRWWGRRAIPIR